MSATDNVPLFLMFTEKERFSITMIGEWKATARN